MRQLARHLLKHVILLAFLITSHVSPHLSRHPLETSSAFAIITVFGFVVDVIAERVAIITNKTTNIMYMCLHFICLVIFDLASDGAVASSGKHPTCCRRCSLLLYALVVNFVLGISGLGNKLRLPCLVCVCLCVAELNLI